MTTKPVTMWAVVVKSKRSEWIHCLTLAQHRKYAIQKYKDKAILAESDSEADEKFKVELKLGDIRLARVVVAEEGGK